MKRAAAAIVAAVLITIAAAIAIVGGPSEAEIKREYGPEHITVVYMDGHTEQEPYTDFWTGEPIIPDN